MFVGGLWIVDCDCGLGCGLWIVGCGLWVMGPLGQFLRTGYIDVDIPCFMATWKIGSGEKKKKKKKPRKNRRIEGKKKRKKGKKN